MSDQKTNQEYVHGVIIYWYQKISKKVGRIDNCLSLVRQSSILPTESDTFDKKQHCVSILYIFKGGYLDFSHVTELVNIYITGIYRRK